MSFRSAASKRDRRAAGGEPRGERLAARGVEVEKADAGALAGEGLDHRRADAGGAAGDQHDLVREVGVGGGHGSLRRCAGRSGRRRGGVVGVGADAQRRAGACAGCARGRRRRARGPRGASAPGSPTPVGSTVRISAARPCGSRWKCSGRMPSVTLRPSDPARPAAARCGCRRRRRSAPSSDLAAEHVHRRRADEAGDEQVRRACRRARAACRSARSRRHASRRCGRPWSWPRSGRGSRRRWWS